MNEDRIIGTARNLGGQAQEGFGRVTGDTRTQAEGIVNQVTGTAQELYGQAKTRRQTRPVRCAEAQSTRRIMSARRSKLGHTRQPCSRSASVGSSAAWGDGTEHRGRPKRIPVSLTEGW